MSAEATAYPSDRQSVQGISRIWNIGVSSNPWGSLPFPSPLPFPFPSLPFPSLPPFPLKPRGCCAKVGGINPPEEGVGNSLSQSTGDSSHQPGNRLSLLSAKRSSRLPSRKPSTFNALWSVPNYTAYAVSHYMITTRLGVEHTTSWPTVWRSNQYTTMPHWNISVHIPPLFTDIYLARGGDSDQRDYELTAWKTGEVIQSWNVSGHTRIMGVYSL